MNPEFKIIMMLSSFLIISCAEEEVEECQSNRDCPKGFVCNVLTNRCIFYCMDDSDCNPGEFCNTQHSCQKAAGCLTNLDCETNEICYTEEKTCIPANECRSSLHCPIGQICRTDTYTCSVGCNDTGDCPIDDKSVCINGLCVTGRCEDSSYCEFAEFCTQNQYCEPATGPYCELCDSFDPNACPGLPKVCNPSGMAPCNSLNDCPSGDLLCSPPCFPIGGGECNTDADCPQGYTCNPLQRICSSPATCWVDCSADKDCPGGFQCMEMALQSGAVLYYCVPTEGYCPNW